MCPLSVQPAILTDLSGYAIREKQNIVGVVVHRIEVSQEDSTFDDNPLEVLRFFQVHPVGIAATGGKMPYPLLIERSGALTQLVPLSRVTPHAKSHNPTTIGVACLGDFRRASPTPAQRQMLVAVSAELLHALGQRTQSLFGHDELAGASADPNKECPGRHLSMNELRADVERALDGEALGALHFLW
jgi:hypothetical protein